MIVAVFVCGLGLTTVARITSVCGVADIDRPDGPQPGCGIVGPLAGRGRDER